MKVCVCYTCVEKKLFSWVNGQYLMSNKLPSCKVTEISSRVIELIRYYSREINLDNRNLYRNIPIIKQLSVDILFFTGPVVLNNILSNDLYEHFLFLHTALRCLFSASPTEE